MIRRLTAIGAALLLGASAVLFGGGSAPALTAERGLSPVFLSGGAEADGGRTGKTGSTRVQVIAHRGASAHAPENTLSAVSLAHDIGAPWVENDVQRTRDGRLVVIHDTTLVRTTDAEERYPDRAPWNVADFTLDEIEKLDAGGWFNPAYTGERVPTLEKYLDLLDSTGQRLLMEIKAPQLYPGIEQDVVAVLRSRGWLGPGRVRDDLVVQSFSTGSLRTLHGLAPQVRTGFLGTPGTDELEEYGRFADHINPPHKSVTPEFVAAVHGTRGAHGKPLRLSAWTVDDWATVRKVAGAGVDGIITNRPDTVLAAMDTAWTMDMG